MRKFLFYGFCVGGLALFAAFVRWFFHWVNLEMGKGIGIGIAVSVFAFWLNEKLDIINGKRDPQTGIKIRD